MATVWMAFDGDPAVLAAVYGDRDVYLVDARTVSLDDAGGTRPRAGSVRVDDNLEMKTTAPPLVKVDFPNGVVYSASVPGQDGVVHLPPLPPAERERLLQGEWRLADPVRGRAEALWEEYHRETDAYDLMLGARDRDGRPDGAGMVPPWNRAASAAFAREAHRLLVAAAAGIPDDVLKEARRAVEARLPAPPHERDR